MGEHPHVDLLNLQENASSRSRSLIDQPAIRKETFAGKTYRARPIETASCLE
jgi:hypothetical protein